MEKLLLYTSCKKMYKVILLGPSRSIKTYWATVSTLWNGKKVPNIPSLLVNNELITEFEAKGNIFKKYLASQCTTVNNNSVLPSTLKFLQHFFRSYFSTNQKSWPK